MNKWEQQFKDNSVHQQIINLKKIVPELRKRQDISQISDVVTRLSSTLDYLELHLKISRAELVSTQLMNTISNSLIAITNEINAFVSNNNIGHINNNVSNNIDSLLPQIGLLPGYSSKKPSEELGRAATDYKDHADALIEVLAKANIEQKMKVDEIIKLTEELKRKVVEQITKIESINARLDSVVSDHQGQFSKSQEARQSEYNAQITQLRKETTDLEADIREKYDALIKRLEQAEQDKVTGFEEQSTTIINNMLAKQGEAARLVGLIGTTVTTGHYRRRAIIEGWSATIFRYIALLLFTGMVASVWRIAYLAAKDGLDWKVILFRMWAAILLLVPAGYAAAQSANHRKVELSNRKRELELAAIDPYLEKMDAQEKSAIKKELVTHFFGDGDDEDTIREKPIKLRDFLKIFEKLAENMGKMRNG